MKSIYKYVSVASLTGFGVLFLFHFTGIDVPFNTIETRNVLVVVYLVTSLRYHKTVLKEKDITIRHLRAKMNQS